MMNRREFIKYSIITTLSCATAASLISCSASPEEALSKQLNRIKDERFTPYIQNYTKQSLLKKLKESDVINKEGKIVTGRIAELALTDSLTVHDDFYYSNTEIELYTLALIY